MNNYKRLIRWQSHNSSSVARHKCTQFNVDIDFNGKPVGRNGDKNSQKDGNNKLNNKINNKQITKLHASLNFREL